MGQIPAMTQPAEPNRGVVDSLSDIKTVVEAIIAIIAAASAVVGFVAANGGLVVVLGQVGIFAFACYVGAFPAAFVIAGLDALGNQLRRQTNDTAFIAIAASVMIIFALLVRFVLFYDGIGEEGDLDAIGQAFSAALGVGALLLPVFLLWYFHGSKPVSN